MRHPFPLRYSLPAVLLLFGLVLAGAVVWNDMYNSRRMIEDESQRQMASLGSRTTSRLEYYYGRSDQAAVERDIALLITEPYLLLGLVFDEFDRVLAGTDPAHRGGHLADTPAQSATDLLTKARETMAAQIEVDQDGSRLAGAFPFRLGLLPGELRPSRVGVLYLEIDLQRPKQVRLAETLQRVGLISVIVLLLLVGVWRYLHRTLTRRAAVLIAVTQEMADGNLARRATLRGSDELAQLGKSFNQMAIGIQLQSEALRQSEEKFRTVVEQAADGFELVDQEGSILDVNAATLQQLGYTRDEMLRMTLFDINPSLERGWLARQGEALSIAEALRLESMHRRKDGSLFPVEITVSPVQLADLRHYSVLVRDITERKQAERENSLLAQTLKSARDCISLTDLDNRIVFVNHAFLETYGYPESELLGKDIRMLRSAEPSSGLRQDNVLRSTLEGEWHGELMNRRKDGTDFPIELWASLVRDSSDIPIAMVGVARDITERKRLEDTLRQALKMEAIGQLAGGVAHDFNNILAAMMMNLDLLQGNQGLDQPTQEALKELETGAQRAARLTRQLLMFGRRSVLEVRLLDLNEVVAHLLNMLGRLLGEHIQLILYPANNLPAVEADVGMLDQVLMNLCVNARDAMPKGGRITIATEAVEIDRQQAQKNPDRRPGQFVCLAVGDTGCGMDEAALQHIFEPFFTTKEVGKGTGLGLATVYGIINQHRGWIEVESQVGQGTTFRIFLPALAKKATETVGSSPPRSVAKGHETILVVEDDQGVRLMLLQTLSTLGYRVLESDNGQEAMALWQNHAQEIDLLFTDMVMPEGMSGLELAERLRAEKPDLKIIISSGYSMDLTELRKTAQGMVYLAKPYRASVLAKTIRECLDR